MAYGNPFRRGEGMHVILSRQQNTAGLYQSRMETERARGRFRRLDSCRGADASDRIHRSGLALVLAWIPYKDERVRTGKRESGRKLQSLSKKDEFISLGFP